MDTTAGLPPGPRAPAALQTFRFVTDPLALLDDCSRRFGDIFTLRLVGSGNWVLFSSPAHVKALFAASPDTARGGEANFAVEVRARALAELQAVLGGRPLEADDVAKLVYLDAVVKEALRVRPIGPIAGHRRLVAPLEIAGYRLPAGTIVGNCCYLSHRRADVFAEPERFNPDRFLRTKPDVHQWTPFGGGERRCPGANFANHEMKVVLATVLAQTKLSLADRAGDVKGVERIGFFIGPRGGLPVQQEAA